MDGGLDDPLVRMHRWDALRQRLANSTAGRLDPVVDEAVEALIVILQRHPSLTFTVTVEGNGARASAQLGWQDGRLTVARSEAQATAPVSATEGEETSAETAARLAELIRRDPSLLDGRERWNGS
ncbi:MAG: hypothetical protein AUG44_12155 [Actinobacteria bacterium 13_1_20CM_3_71_11]|nr:MAG: hypothetical protein AUG44_12155 [Actinobacteria bacterium 13_1_20CM_3_71_11]